MKRQTVFFPILAALVAISAPAWSATEEERVAAAVENTLRKHAPDAHRCFEQALADKLDVAGKVELEVTVGAGGQIKKAVRCVARRQDPRDDGGLCIKAS